jgi:RNA polymerase sigma-70 factor (ECF subfamily)
VGAEASDLQLLERLRDGDDRAFEALVASHHRAMLSVARMYVSSRAVAEEVVQEAWLGVIKGLDGFEGRSSLRTWILRIVANLAQTRGGREARSIPFAPAVDPDRFEGPDGRYPGHWREFPTDWRALPEEALLERETLRVALDAIEALPPAQRTVIAMRDMQGCDPDEVCAVLDVSEGNQRVLLHRARSQVRAALEVHLA